MKQNNETIINIFWGPRKEFNKYVTSKTGKEGFVSIIQEYDRNSKRVPLYIENNPNPENIKPNSNNKTEKRKIETLIVNSDDYSSITESAVQNFIAILDGFDVNEVCLQNPPQVVVDNLKKVYSKINEDKFKYKKIVLNDIKIISRNYNKKVIGQDEAIRSLLRNLLAFIKFSKNTKPLVIMFYGPSGVGKTETAKYLSSKMGGKIFFKQFSMFQNNDFSTYLFGGSHSQNSFSKELLDRNSNVILLDEFDKAHSHFYSAFYQLFDEGIYIDKNYEVFLDNTIIICTSNYKTTEEIREKLGDPIYYRFDAFIEFKELNEDAINKIIDLKYKSYLKQLNIKDQKKINSIKYNNISLIDLLRNNTKKLKNARKIDNIVKELLLDELLKIELDGEKSTNENKKDHNE